MYNLSEECVKDFIRICDVKLRKKINNKINYEKRKAFIKNNTKSIKKTKQKAKQKTKEVDTDKFITLYQYCKNNGCVPFKDWTHKDVVKISSICLGICKGYEFETDRNGTLKFKQECIAKAIEVYEFNK